MIDDSRVRCLMYEPKASPGISDECFIVHKELTKNKVVVIFSMFCYIFITTVILLYLHTRKSFIIMVSHDKTKNT